MRLNGLIPARPAPPGNELSPLPDRSRPPRNLSTVACEQIVTNSSLLSRPILGLLPGSQNDVKPTLNRV
jgi:hypothetical protein